MKRILDWADQGLWAGVAVARENWTALIPAAGQGVRLRYKLPKVLYPVLDRPTLWWLRQALEPVAARAVIVASPAGCEAITAAIVDCCAGWEIEVVVQDHPLGMADAVRRGDGHVSTPGTLVVWGDQLGLRRETVEACVKVHTLRKRAMVTLPTVLCARPYIHLERNVDGRILRVSQAREGDQRVAYGESDCGVFSFSTAPLFNVLRECESLPEVRGGETGELNLLPLLPCFEGDRDEVVTLRIAGAGEVLGVNTAEEAKAIESILRARSDHEYVKR